VEPKAGSRILRKKEMMMMMKPLSATFCIAMFVFGMCVPAFPQGKFSSAVGDVQFEFVGQAGIPSATGAQNLYGYLSYIKGISGIEPIFNPGPQNETTALFTFFHDTVVERVTNNGPIRIIDRVGTTTVYFDMTPNGDFANPNSFRDGVPVQTSELRLQFTLDTLTGSFTATFVNTITSSDFFNLGFRNFLLGKAGQKFRTTNIGHVNMSGAPAAHFAGVAVGDLKR
jgi:hypothetical protein